MKQSLKAIEWQPPRACVGYFKNLKLPKSKPLTYFGATFVTPGKTNKGKKEVEWKGEGLKALP